MKRNCSHREESVAGMMLYFCLYLCIFSLTFFLTYTWPRQRLVPVKQIWGLSCCNSLKYRLSGSFFVSEFSILELRLLFEVTLCMISFTFVGLTPSHTCGDSGRPSSVFFQSNFCSRQKIGDNKEVERRQQLTSSSRKSLRCPGRWRHNGRNVIFFFHPA